MCTEWFLWNLCKLALNMYLSKCSYHHRTLLDTWTWSCNLHNSCSPDLQLRRQTHRWRHNCTKQRRRPWQVRTACPRRSSADDGVNLTLRRCQTCWRPVPQRRSGPRWRLAAGRFLRGRFSEGHWGPRSLRFLSGHRGRTSASCTL